MSTAEPITPTRPRIVAGFDNSPSGFDAVALGRQIAAATDARLVVAHVYVNAVSGIDVAMYDSEIAEDIRARAVRTVRRAGIVLEGFEDWETMVYPSTPAARGLHEVAERVGATLIVVGSTHRHGLGRVMPGATAERLLHGSGLPILVAPAGWRRDSLETIGAGFDDSDESHAALIAAATLARASGASLRALSVFEAPHPANPAFAVTTHGYTEIMGQLREELQRRLDDALAPLPSGLDATGEVLDGHPVDVLTAESERLDLLVVGSRGYGAMRATLAGSVAHHLATTSHCPLLLVPRGVEQPLHGLARRRRRPKAAH